MKILSVVTMLVAMVIFSQCLVSCSSSSSRSSIRLDQEFVEPHKKFVAEMKARGITPQNELRGIRWSENAMENAAEFLPDMNSIRVAPRHKNLSENELLLMMGHELAHAYLAIADGLVEGNDDFMSQGGFSEEIKANPWQKKYLDRLFDPKLFGTLKAPYLKPPLVEEKEEEEGIE